MALNYVYTESPESKMRSPDRIFKLEVIDGTKPRSAMGTVDPSLFKEDGNRLHVIMDLETSLWGFKYDRGFIPQALAGKYTGFKQAKEDAARYFEKRNIRITEVLD